MRVAFLGFDYQVDLLAIELEIARLDAVDQRADSEAQITVRDAQIGRAPADGRHFPVQPGRLNIR